MKNKAVTWVLFALMIGASFLAVFLRPGVVPRAQQIDLEAVIPAHFGEWKIDTNIVPIAPSPELQATLDKTYDQVLSRTYVDPRGHRMMLSIAYSGTYSKGTQYHRPEICYPSQGFRITDESSALLDTPYGALPEKRLVAVAGSRNEPITYWFVVGGEGYKSTWGARIAQVKSGLTGQIPDGMLVRVSSIDKDKAGAYKLQDSFILQMLEAMAPQNRAQVIGVSKS